MAGEARCARQCHGPTSARFPRPGAPGTAAPGTRSRPGSKPSRAHGTPADGGGGGPRGRWGRADVRTAGGGRAARGAARRSVPPQEFQHLEPFGGTRPPVITRREFEDSGFTGAHLAGTRLRGWRMPSSLVVLARQAIERGESFVYTYYDGIDKVAHEHGFGDLYDAEVQAADRLVGDLL